MTKQQIAVGSAPSVWSLLATRSTLTLRSVARPHATTEPIYGVISPRSHPRGAQQRGTFALGRARTRDGVRTLRDDIVRVLAPLGPRFSEAKTRIAHISESLDFLGFRIQWRRKRGTSKWYVYTFIADLPGKRTGSIPGTAPGPTQP